MFNGSLIGDFGAGCLAIFGELADIGRGLRSFFEAILRLSDAKQQGFGDLSSETGFLRVIYGKKI